MPEPNEQRIRSLRFSLWDGIFASGMIGFTQDYFTPFLLLLGAGAGLVGLLSSIPNLVSALVQLKTADLSEKIGSRKKFITTFVFMQALVLLVMSWIAFSDGTSPMNFIILVTLFTSVGSFLMPVWGSLMSDLVAENKRGEYFGWRNKILGVLIVVFSFVAGNILHIFESKNIFYGFAFIFGAACICRFVSWYFLTRMYEPPLIAKKEDYFNFFMFIRRRRESNFAQFVLFVAAFNFTVYLASPFFAVFMLRELQFSYFLYTAVTVTATGMIYLMMGRWGRHADRVGNLRVLRFTAPFIAVLPLLWVFNQNPGYLFVVQCVSGFAWAGFNLCASNFIYDVAKPEKRTRCIAYFNVVNGAAICLGAFIGGILVDKVIPFLGLNILSLFVLSSILRLWVAVRGPISLKEVRPVEKVSSEQLFFSMVKIKPILGVDEKTIRF